VSRAQGEIVETKSGNPAGRIAPLDENVDRGRRAANDRLLARRDVPPRRGSPLAQDSTGFAHP